MIYLKSKYYYYFTCVPTKYTLPGFKLLYLGGGFERDCKGGLCLNSKF